MKGIFGKLSKKQLYALCGVLLIIICAGIFFATRKPEGGVDEEAPFRKKPKAMGTPYIDPAVMMQGANAWHGVNYQATARQALDIVNQQRAGSGLAPLSWNDNLSNCAMVRATELPASFSHTRPNGMDWYTVCADLMYGENLAYGYNNANGVVNGWMNSPAHRANIMNGSFTTCGIGLYDAGGTWYWAQEFGY